MYTKELDELCESWARWVHRGGLAVSGQSVLSKLIDNHGVMNYGSGGSGPTLNCVEADIEAALMSFYVVNPAAVELFRLQYGAIQRPGFDPDNHQIDKAAALGISARTYKRRLGLVRAHITEKLTKSRAKHVSKQSIHVSQSPAAPESPGEENAPKSRRGRKTSRT
tara:strand:+ start:13915 stop:14412 length:498 start_codon:yes stop_codon:yes gene_type:complete